ncbi:MAG: pyruvate kinase [Planctomycetota bacterium]|nr:MAG: pyruvate kinase [Planctomycetota bacterium]
MAAEKSKKAKQSGDQQAKPSGGRGKLPTRTKIVATLGPASSGLTTVRKLIRAGVDVFRLNFSHGTHTAHKRLFDVIRKAGRSERRAVGILADLQGPKIRVGRFAKNEPFLLNPGDELLIDTRPDVLGEPGRIACTYPELGSDVRVGERILLDDGNIELRVRKIEGPVVHTTVRYGGLLREHKGINLPGSEVSAPSVSEKDLFDLHFALMQQADYVALSFVRSAKDVKRLRQEIQSFGGDAQIIAKIERPEAVAHAEEIIDAADGVMVARGDMGVELGAEMVPGVQKRLIHLCIAVGKPVITATQMLESMIVNPRPTRAEASDIANAIYDGTSAVMLSAESATGAYPELAVRTMDRIARSSEADIFRHSYVHPAKLALSKQRPPFGQSSVVEATVSAAAQAALLVGAQALVVFTESGRTANFVARERLPLRTVVFTPDRRVWSQLCLQWGVIPELAIKARSVSQLYRYAMVKLLERKHVKEGDLVVFISGTMAVKGATNTFSIRELRL